MSAAVDPSAPIAWTPGVQLVSRLSRADGRQLLLTLASFDGEDWYAGAIEVAEGVKTAAAALDAHAHHLVGTFSDHVLATMAAEDYGRGWLASSAAAAECSCSEIAPEVIPVGNLLDHLAEVPPPVVSETTDLRAAAGPELAPPSR